MKSIQLWVTLKDVLKDVPSSLFTDKGLEFLASAVGRPIRLHPKTEACVSFEEAQILAEADLTKDLPKEYVFRGEEEGELDAMIKYSYPWLPPRCSCCEKWGHLRDSCLAEARKIAQDEKNSTASSVSDTELATKVSTPAPEQNVAVEIVSVPNSIEGQNGNVASPADGVEQGSDDQGWITPPKTSSSPSKRSEGQSMGRSPFSLIPTRL